MLISRVLQAAALGALLALSACAFLPGEGPSGLDISLAEAARSEKLNSYLMVPLTAVTVSKINFFEPISFPSEFKTSLGGSHAMTIGVGDKLLINIWEPSQDGIFATAENKQTALKAIVDEEGMIYIPYAGRIRAAGRRVESLRQAIQDGLKGKAVEPQVQVLLEENTANTIVVVGDVASPGLLPVPLRGVRLMEAVAQAGGTRAPTYESVATVTRGKRSGTVRLDDVAASAQNNIWLAPGDNVLVLHQPRTYSAFGAVKRSGLTPFKSETLTLVEAVAQAGGLLDARADAGGVFLFRFESRELARWLVDVGSGGGTLSAMTTERVPVIYRLDFKSPDSFFLAQTFRMRDKDVLYVANHPTAELSKFLSTIVSPLLGVARSTAAMEE
ncbi:polysaccharide biosynthesis/export family protein [Chelativorans sp. Marseille-P2723]|uniref:polysaccharide biosynthesis/export family protein n=1 Tax=Chelativorans sp. Marseille-P2723 TaxID=2709133 RepID=UPI00156EF4C8|nr:polysaccharide biosynthesis/export family protein [Chelativorans sp. Marseille-P2723]